MPDTWKQRLTAWKQRFRAFLNTKAAKIIAFIFAIPAAIAIAVGIAVTIYSHLYRMTPTGMPKIPEHLRNLIFMTAGLITFAISIWRARISDKQAKASNIQAEATIEQIKIAAQSQITDRFTRAIEQLGKSGDDILFLRIGAIQALERIGNDSLGDLPAIIRLLAGFSRQTSIAWYESIRNQEGQVVVTPLDVAEAVRALARLNGKHLEFLREQEISIDLSGSYFPRLSLPNSNLTRFELTDCDLSNANLRDANLSDAKLRKSDLSNAMLWGANFSNAILVGVNLYNAILRNSNLSNADLWYANLSNATLWDTNLSNAKLQGINLSKAFLLNSDLSGADISIINLDRKTMKIREGTTELLSEIKYDKDNPPVNCPEGVELPPPRDG